MARCSPLAAVIAVSLHDVVTPLWPLVLDLEYRLGVWLLTAIGRPPDPVDIRHFRLHDLLQWTTFFDVGFPLLVGSLLVAAPAAIVAYVLTSEGVRRSVRSRSASTRPANEPPPRDGGP